jgi:hypothetical protein
MLIPVLMKMIDATDKYSKVDPDQLSNGLTGMSITVDGKFRPNRVTLSD